MPYTQNNLPWAPQSETSYEAAVRAAGFQPTQGQRYWSWLQQCGAYGATDAEVELQMPMRRSSVCARRNEWMKQGRIVYSGLRRGRCAVWVAV